MITWPDDSRWDPDVNNDTYTIGHAGVDYASFDLINGYNPKYQFGISLAVNSVTGLNCSTPLNITQLYGGYGMYYDVACVVYDEVIQLVAKAQNQKNSNSSSSNSNINSNSGGSTPLPPRLNCSTCPTCVAHQLPSVTCMPLLQELCPMLHTGTHIHMQSRTPAQDGFHKSQPVPFDDLYRCFECVQNYSIARNISNAYCTSEQKMAHCGLVLSTANTT
jgi:hypothetical protein